MPEDNNSSTGAGWAYNPDSTDMPSAQAPDRPQHQLFEPVNWTGSEYLSHQKNPTWYLALSVAVVVVCGVIYLFSRDLLSVGFIVVMGVLFAIIASRKPRQLQYEISQDGLFIGNRHYFFEDFKSFSLQRDGGIGYISLLPLKRLMPELVIYYVPEDENRIFEALSLNIPHEHHKENLVDKFARIIRF